MGNQPFSFKNRVEGGFLDDFDGAVIKFGFTTGFVPADKSGTGEPVTTHQAFALWLPTNPPEGEEAKAQPSWYGMGGKEYVFGGKTEEISLGDKDTKITVYAEIKEGPPLTKQSRFGMFLERCASFGFDPEGGNGASFIGLIAHLKREKYEKGKTKSDKEALMPTAILAKPGKGATKAAAAPASEPETTDEDIDATLMKLMEGLGDKDVPKLDKETLKELGLSTAKVYTRLSKLEKAGTFIKDGEGKYHQAE